MATSEPRHLAMADSLPLGLPRSMSQAARQMTSRAASTSMAIWAILKAVAWNEAMGLPNWTLVLEYSTAYSRAARAMPIPAAPTAARVLSHVRRATMNPRPPRPRRLAAGTRG